MTTTTQFREVTTPSGKKAVEAFVAANKLGPHEVFIGAPTLLALEFTWKQITGKDLISEKAQHVFIVSASNEAPSVAPAPANVKCSVLGCTSEASFIIHKLAYCAQHRKVGRL